MSIRKNITIILLFIFAVANGKEYRFEHLGVEHGLSDLTVRSIYQDEINRIWIATYDGLNCYDGNKVRDFRQQIGEVHDVNIHSITRICGNQKGVMYLYSAAGIVEFNLKTERMRIIYEKPVTAFFYHEGFLWFAAENVIKKYDTTADKITSNYKLPYKDIEINDIIIDKKGDKWIATRNYGLLFFSSLTNRVSIAYRDTHGRCVFEDRDGNIWYTTHASGVYRINPVDNKVKHFVHDPNNPASIADGFNRAITQDYNGNIWLGTNRGLSCIQYSTDEVSRMVATTSPNSLSSSSINELFTDKRGTVWIGTYFGGVSYFNPSQQNYNYVVPGEGDMPNYPAIGSFCEDNSGKVWVCSEGGGVYCYHPENQSLKNFRTTNSAISSNYIKKIINDPLTGKLWIGADNTGVLNSIDPVTNVITRHALTLPDGYIPRAVFAMAVHGNVVYVGTEMGVIAYNKQTHQTNFIYKLTRQFNANSNDILIDSKGRMWFANGNSPVTYSLDNEELTYYSYGLKNSQYESNRIANYFFEDKSGQIWLGTNGYGVLKLNEREKKFETVEEFNGLSNRTVMAIAQTHTGNLLITSTQSLYVYDVQKKSLKQMNFKMNFPLRAFIKRGLFVSTTGDIYVGGVPTMVIYQEKNLIPGISADKIQLTSLFVNNQEVLPGDATGILSSALAYSTKITLRSSQKYLTIMYSTDNFFKTNESRIEYILKGYDQGWNVANLGHTISYTNLAPGKYNFEIRSKDHPDAIKTLSIKVNAPFYATIWAYLFYLFVLGIIIYYFVREYHTQVNLRSSLAFQEREKQQIEEMNQSKIRFFINISHEIRTPITLVLAQTEILLNTPHLHAKTRSKIMSIHRNLLSMKHLVTELMDFRKQERGELKLKYSETDLVALLREHYNLFKGLGETRDIQFNFISPYAFLPIWIDSEQMIKVVNNLTINAFKFTKEGGSIIISLEDDKDQVRILFEDTGTGIPEKDIDLIFNRFYQSKNSQEVGGTGIGLALSKGIVEAHHGELSVRSVEGQGSVFTITLRKGNSHVPEEHIENLPVPIENQYAPITEQELNDIISGEELVNHTQKPLVLVVEDNKELCELIANAISVIYNVEKAYDGVEGWEKVRELEPHLVITDVMMPRMSGVDLCAQIKKNYKLCHIPVILLTARQSEEYEIEGLRLGADSYLTKPFEIKKLIVVSNNLINSRKLILKKFEQNRIFETELPATNEYDKEFIDRITAIINDNLENEAFDVDTLGSEIGVSRTKLFGKIKDIAGTTPNNLIQDMRLKKAADYLLNNPEMNIADIAYQLCFNSPRYFNKCFKEKFGVAPLHYKKENMKENTTSQAELEL